MARKNSFLSLSHEDKLQYRWSSMLEIESGLDHCTVEQLVAVLKTISAISMYILVVHDQDVKDGKEVKEHFHCLVRLRAQIQNSALLKAFDDHTGHERSVNTRPIESWEAAVVYLLHETTSAKSKAKYPLTALRASDGVNASEYWMQCYERYLHRCSTKDDTTVESDDGKKRRTLRARIEYYKPLIESGQLREYNMTDYQDEETFIADRGLIKQLMDYDMKRRKLEGHFEKMRVYWFSGPAGARKTAFAKYICQDHGYGIPYITGSGKDFLGEYEGQRFVILDDFRPDNAAASTLLKLLDPYTRSSVDSRYRNKWLAADYVVITAPQTPEQWWQYHRDHGDEYAGAWEQLTRRINGASMHFNMDGSVQYVCYDAVGHTQLIKELPLPPEFLAWLDEQKRVGMLPTDLLESYFGADVRTALPPTPPVVEQKEEPEPDDGGELPFPE